MNTKRISTMCSHIPIYMILPLLSIIVQIVESRKILSLESLTLQSDRDYETSAETSFRYSAYGNYHNITNLEPKSPELIHKLPPSLISLAREPSIGNIDHESNNNRLAFDIKQVVLTNLDADQPLPVTINNHEDYSRESDGFEFSNRYIQDENSAIGISMYNYRNA